MLRGAATRLCCDTDRTALRRSKFWGESSSEDESDFDDSEEQSEEFAPNSKYLDSDDDSGFEGERHACLRGGAMDAAACGECVAHCGDGAASGARTAVRCAL